MSHDPAQKTSDTSTPDGRLVDGRLVDGRLVDGRLVDADGPLDADGRLVDGPLDADGPNRVDGDGPAQDQVAVDAGCGLSGGGSEVGKLYPSASSCVRWAWSSPVAANNNALWPLPRNTLRAAHAFSDDDIWAVGDAGTVLHKTSTGWHTRYVGGTVDLLAVWGASSSDVWVGGTDSTLLRLTPAGPTPAALPPFTTVHALWGRDATDVWAATNRGPFHYDGSNWSVDPNWSTTSLGLVDIAGVPGSNNVVATVDENGDIWRQDGASGKWIIDWQKKNQPFHLLHSAGGVTLATGSKSAYASPFTLRYFETTPAWNEPKGLTPTTTFGPVTGLGGHQESSGDAIFFLAQASGKVQRLKVSATFKWAWSDTYQAAGAYKGTFFGVASWSGGAENAIFVGQGGRIERQVKSKATAVVGNPGALSLRRLTLASNGDVFAIGTAAEKNIFRLAGPTAYGEILPNGGVPPQSLWALDATTLWAGDPFALRLYNGWGWSDPKDAGGKPIGGPVVDIWGVQTPPGQAEVWALAGAGKAIYRKLGQKNAAFDLVKSPVPNWNYQRIWGYKTGSGGAASVGVVVAGAGKAWRFDGSWKPLAGAPAGKFLSLWADSKVAYAIVRVSSAAAGGTLYYHDGTSWSAVALPSPGYGDALHGVWARSKKDVWAVGERGVILHFDGSKWQQEISPTRNTLYAVGGDTNNVWALGDWGTVLRLQ